MIDCPYCDKEINEYVLEDYIDSTMNCPYCGIPFYIEAETYYALNVLSEKELEEEGFVPDKCPDLENQKYFDFLDKKEILDNYRTKYIKKEELDKRKSII